MNKELLENILDFLNKVPNRKYGDNYQLASELEKLIKELESQDIMQIIVTDKIEKLVKEEFDRLNEKEILYYDVVHLLQALKKDAKWALSGKWDKDDEGFDCQIVSINEMLEKLKSTK